MTTDFHSEADVSSSMRILQVGSAVSLHNVFDRASMHSMGSAASGTTDRVPGITAQILEILAGYVSGEFKESLDEDSDLAAVGFNSIDGEAGPLDHSIERRFWRIILIVCAVPGICSQEDCQRLYASYYLDFSSTFRNVGI